MGTCILDCLQGTFMSAYCSSYKHPVGALGNNFKENITGRGILWFIHHSDFSVPNQPSDLQWKVLHSSKVSVSDAVSGFFPLFLFPSLQSLPIPSLPKYHCSIHFSKVLLLACWETFRGSTVLTGLSPSSIRPPLYAPPVCTHAGEQLGASSPGWAKLLPGPSKTCGAFASSLDPAQRVERTWV